MICPLIDTDQLLTRMIQRPTVMMRLGPMTVLAHGPPGNHNDKHGAGRSQFLQGVFDTAVSVTTPIRCHALYSPIREARSSPIAEVETRDSACFLAVKVAQRRLAL